MIAPSVGGTPCRTRPSDLVRPSLYVASGILAAALLGFGLGVVGAALPEALIRVGWGLIAVTAGAYVVGSLLGMRIGVPQRDWMIPSDWSWDGETRYAITFGALLGAGLFTKVSYIGYHLLLMLCVALRDPLTAMVVMGAFGLIRTMPVLAFPLAALVRGACFDQRPASRAVDVVLALEHAVIPARQLLLVATCVIAAWTFLAS